MAQLKDYTSRGLDGKGATCTLDSLEAALKDMTPERWDWHNEDDDSSRTALEAYWNKVENEWTAFTIKNLENPLALKQAEELHNQYAPVKHYK